MASVLVPTTFAALGMGYIGLIILIVIIVIVVTRIL
jgi:hypothetical protein